MAFSALGLHWVFWIRDAQALWRLFSRRLLNRRRLWLINGRRRWRLVYRRGWLTAQCGFDVLFALCSQRKPGVRHREQWAPRFQIIETLDEPKALLGVSPIPFYQLRHASDPRPLEKRISASTAMRKIRSIPRHLTRCDRQKRGRRGGRSRFAEIIRPFIILPSGTRLMRVERLIY